MGHIRPPQALRILDVDGWAFRRAKQDVGDARS
jgi:hypothetical protein